MPKKKSVVHHLDNIVASSFNNTSDDHESLGANYDQALEAHTTSLDAGLLRAMPPHRVVSSERELFNWKYIVQWKPDHSM
jgi:hypothetical protein